MKVWTSPLGSVRVAVVVCAAAAAAVFVNSVPSDFAYDDLGIISNNDPIHSIETLPGAMLKPYWPGDYGPQLGLWRPGATALYGLEWILFDGSPTGFHVVNVLLHVAATALVVLLLARLLPLAPALLGGLVFAVHPVHTEAVANVVGQSELASAVFYLLACLVYLGRPAFERMSARRLAAVWLLFAASFSFKEMAVTLPGALFLLDGTRTDLTFGNLKDYARRRWSLYGGLVVATGLILFMRYLILGSVARPFAPLGGEILEHIPRIWTVAGLWPEYVRLLFFPVDLSSDYAPAVLPILYGWILENTLGVFIALAFLGLAWATWRTSGPMRRKGDGTRALGFGVLWIVITITPVSNFFFLSGVLVAERTLYLPSVGFVLAVGWVLWRLVGRQRALGWSVVVVLVALLGYRTWVRNPDWKDNLTVFNVMVRDHPESGRSQWVVGDTYYSKGDMHRALRAYRLAVGFLGTEYPLLTQIGARLAQSGYPEQAEILLRFAWNSSPESRGAPALLATVLAQQGRYREAEQMARGVLARGHVENPLVPQALSLALAGQSRYAEAAASALEAIQLGRDDLDQWRWLARLYVHQGDTTRATEALDSARMRARTAAELRQIDSIQADLTQGGVVSNSANSSHNPTGEHRE